MTGSTTLHSIYIYRTFCTIRYHLNVLARLRGGRGPCWFLVRSQPAVPSCGEIRPLISLTPLTFAGLVYKENDHAFFVRSLLPP